MVQLTEWTTKIKRDEQILFLFCHSDTVWHRDGEAGRRKTNVGKCRRNPLTIKQSDTLMCKSKSWFCQRKPFLTTDVLDESEQEKKSHVWNFQQFLKKKKLCQFFLSFSSVSFWENGEKSRCWNRIYNLERAHGCWWRQNVTVTVSGIWAWTFKAEPGNVSKYQVLRLCPVRFISVQSSWVTQYQHYTFRRSW